MRIRVKLTILAAFLITVAIVASCLLVFSFSRQNTMDRVFSSGIADYERLYNGWSGLDANQLGNTEQERERYVKYYFSNLYGSNEFALLKGDKIISNNTGIDAQAVLRVDTQSIMSEAYALKLTYKYQQIGNQTYLVVGSNHSLSGETYNLFLVRNVTDTLMGIEALAAKCIGISAVIIVISALLMSFLICRSLKPMERLRQSAKALKSGDYKSRISISGRNEITELADSFNSMADAIEQHILEIEATSEERKLLFSALSHEMKTPVTAINTCSYSLTHTKMSNEQTQETIKFIDAECNRLERLSGKLAQLISMQGEGLMLADVSIDTLVGELRSILHPIAEQAGMTLAFDCSGDTLLAEKDLIICLISNLFDNARKAGATDVHVCIREKEISVTDNGKGIPMEQIEKITQPFYVIDKSRNAEGFGLGLALVKRIAELHRAELIIESEIGKGASIKIRS